jgi:hypothetical protein
MANRNIDTEGLGKAVAVTKSDVTDLGRTRAVWVGGVGDLVVTMADGVDVTFTAVPAGSWLWIQVQKVKAATTATNIVALY